MVQPEFLSLSPEELHPNPWNTNVVTPDNEVKLEESIKRNGMFKPVIVRKTADGLEIIGGENRWSIAKKLGYETIPVVNLGEIDDRRAKEISVLDNSRYGADDTLSFSELLKELGDISEIQDFLPYSDDDISLIFSSDNIALDDLDIDENFEAQDDSQSQDEKPEKPAKTHTVMRFKVSLRDAERLTGLIARTQKEQGLTSADDLTNAGDALVHLLLEKIKASEEENAFTLDEVDKALAEVNA